MVLANRQIIEALVRELRYYRRDDGGFDTPDSIRLHEEQADRAIREAEAVLNKRNTTHLVEGYNGRVFAAKVLVRGDKYGLDERLKWDDDEPCVEFYDTTFAHQKGFPRLGQFVSRYYLSTVLRHWGELILHGGTPEWAIPGESMEALKSVLG